MIKREALSWCVRVVLKATRDVGSLSSFRVEPDLSGPLVTRATGALISAANKPSPRGLGVSTLMRQTVLPSILVPVDSCRKPSAVGYLVTNNAVR